LAIYYITHLETDPLTQRSRFIIFNQEQEKKLGEMILEAVSKRNKYSCNKEIKDFKDFKAYLKYFSKVYIV